MQNQIMEIFLLFMKANIECTHYGLLKFSNCVPINANMFLVSHKACS